MYQEKYLIYLVKCSLTSSRFVDTEWDILAYTAKQGGAQICALRQVVKVKRFLPMLSMCHLSMYLQEEDEEGEERLTARHAGAFLCRTRSWSHAADLQQQGDKDQSPIEQAHLLLFFQFLHFFLFCHTSVLLCFRTGCSISSTSAVLCLISELLLSPPPLTQSTCVCESEICCFCPTLLSNREKSQRESQWILFNWT